MSTYIGDFVIITVDANDRTSLRMAIFDYYDNNNKASTVNVVNAFRDNKLNSSLIVGVNDSKDVKHIKDLAFKVFDKKSIIFGDDKRNMKRIHKNGKETELGSLTLVDKETAFKNKEYLISNVINNKDEYFIFKLKELKQ